MSEAIKPQPYRPTRLLPKEEGVHQRISGCVSKGDIDAIKACYEGRAEKDQQRRAIEAIMYGIARKDDLGYSPDDPGGRDTAFFQGMRHVGLEIQRFLNKKIVKEDSPTPNATDNS